MLHRERIDVVVRGRERRDAALERIDRGPIIAMSAVARWNDHRLLAARYRVRISRLPVTAEYRNSRTYEGDTWTNCDPHLGA
jgi:hypothetical protein